MMRPVLNLTIIACTAVGAVVIVKKTIQHLRSV